MFSGLWIDAGGQSQVSGRLHDHSHCSPKIKQTLVLQTATDNQIVISLNDVVFIDEINTIATKCFNAQTGADREVQQILLELLNQMASFNQGSNIEVGLHIFIDSGINILLGYLSY